MPPRPRLSRPLAAAAFALLMLTPSVRADAEADPQSLTAEIVARLPIQTRAVLAVRGLGTLLDDTGISPIRELARARLIDRGVNDAWEGLAARLECTPREAVERLVGTRAILAVGEQADGPRPGRAGPEAVVLGPLLPWVVLSEVDEQSALRLAAALEGVPRRVDSGRPVYALEGGDFLLSTLPMAPSERGKRAWMLLGSRDHAAWFTLVLRAGRGPPHAPPAADTLGATEAYAEWRRLGAGDLSLLVRTAREAAPPAAAPAAWRGYLVASGRTRAAAPARPAGCEVAVAFVSESAATRAQLAGYPLVPEARMDALEQGAVAALSAGAPAGVADAPPAFVWPPLPGLRASVLGRGPGSGQTPTASILVLRAEPVSGRALVLEACQTGRAPAELDSRIAALAGRSPDPLAPQASLGGLLPGVPRSLVLDLPAGSPLQALTGTPVAAAWVAQPPDESGRAWWACALAGSTATHGDPDPATDAARRTARARADAALADLTRAIAPAPQRAGDPALMGGGADVRVLRRWVARGVIDVPGLARLVGLPMGLRAGPDGVQPFDLGGMLARVGVISWRLWADESGGLHGDIDIAVAPGGP